MIGALHNRNIFSHNAGYTWFISNFFSFFFLSFKNIDVINQKFKKNSFQLDFTSGCLVLIFINSVLIIFSSSKSSWSSLSESNASIPYLYKQIYKVDLNFVCLRKLLKSSSECCDLFLFLFTGNTIHKYIGNIKNALLNIWNILKFV